MRVALLCGSLEPGRDGVGDYVRRIGAALASSGHPCLAIALADRHIAATRSEETIDGSLQVLRLPWSAWEAGTLEAAARAMQQFAPHVCSLQMVGYGYDSHGLLWRAHHRLRELQGSWKRHLMLHELWLGATEGASLKERIVGALQKHTLLRFIDDWSAADTHTSNDAYLELLRLHQVRAALLPLPGTIPVATHVDIDVLRKSLTATLPSASDRREPLFAALFGSIHGPMLGTAWPGRLELQCRAAGRRLVLVQLGRLDAVGNASWHTLKERHGSSMDLLSLGELPAPRLSSLLQSMDLGISTNPWALTGKSGTVATMREHGLPVCIVRDDYRLRATATPRPPVVDGLTLLDDDLIANLDERRRAARAAADPARALKHIESAFLDLVQQPTSRRLRA
jgi:hypothetical protein